jgi:hypothetical protein
MFDRIFRSCTGETLEISHEMNSHHESQGEAETTTTIMLDRSKVLKKIKTRKHYARYELLFFQFIVKYKYQTYAGIEVGENYS